MGQQRAVRRHCPTCQAVIEFLVSQPATSDPNELPITGFCGACGGEVPVASVVTASLAPISFQDAYRPPGIRVERAVLRTTSLFRKHWLPILVLSTILHLLWYLATGVPSWLSTSFDWPATPSQFFVGGAAVGLGLFMILSVTSIFILGMTEGVLRVARYGDNQAFATWDLVPRNLNGRSIGAMAGLVVLFLSGIAVAMGLSLAAMVIAMIILPPEQASAWGVIVASTIVLLTAFLLEWLLWPTAFLIADERSGLIRGLQRSVGLSWRHLRSSLQLIVIYTIITTIGSLLFPVLPIVATPLALLPLADGYIQMTGSLPDQISTSE